MDLGAELILQSKKPVMIMGGFNGGDHPVTLSGYKEMTRKGIVKYAIITNQSTRNDNSQDNITDWIIKNSTVVNEKFEGFSLYELKVEE